MLFKCFIEEQKAKTFILKQYCFVLNPTLTIPTILKWCLPPLLKALKLLLWVLNPLTSEYRQTLHVNTTYIPTPCKPVMKWKLLMADAKQQSMCFFIQNYEAVELPVLRHYVVLATTHTLFKKQVTHSKKKKPTHKELVNRDSTSGWGGTDRTPTLTLQVSPTPTMNHTWNQDSGQVGVSAALGQSPYALQRTTWSKLAKLQETSINSEKQSRGKTTLLSFIQKTNSSKEHAISGQLSLT